MRATTLLIAVVLGSTALVAQAAPEIRAQPDTLYVTAEGKFEAAPDTATMQFNIAAQDQSPQAALERASKAAEAMRQVLRANGIDPKQAEVGFYSLQPVYDYRSPQHHIVGFRVTSAVTLKLHDFSKLGPLIQQLAGIEDTENQSVQYTLENMDAAKLRAVDDAFARARGEAEALALAGKRLLGALLYATVDTQEEVRVLAAPAPMMMRAMAAAPEMPAPTAEFTPQKIVVTAHVTAMFGMK